jgi:hypothetical protein
MMIMHSRHYQRVPFFCKATLIVLPAGTRVNAYTFDISAGGVGLNAQGACPYGSNVRVAFYLKGPSGVRVEQVPGQVAYVKADESGTRIGIEFQSPVQESTQPELARRLLGLQSGASCE